MDNDAPNYRSRSDANRRLFGDDDRDADPVASDAPASSASSDRLFAPPPRYDNPPADDAPPRRAPAGDRGTAGSSVFDSPRSSLFDHEPDAPSPRRREDNLLSDPKDDFRPRSSSLFDTPSRDAPADRASSAGASSPSSSSSRYDRAPASEGSVFSRDPLPPIGRRDNGQDDAPPLRGSLDRGYEPERTAPQRRTTEPPPRLDRLGDPPRTERSGSLFDRGTSGASSGYSPDAGRGYEDRRPEPPRSDPYARGYDAPGADAYQDPRDSVEQPYSADAYEGFHARELAGVDDDYAREYEYTDESVDFRRAEPSGFDEFTQYDDQYAEYPTERRRRGPFLLLGSLIGVAAIAGGLILVYKQGVREGQQDQVPVVEAPADPARVEPTDPGGIEVSGRTKLIYDRIIGEATVTEETFSSREEPLLDPSGQANATQDQSGTQTSSGQQGDTGTAGEPLPLPLPPPPSAPAVGQQGSLQQPSVDQAVTQVQQAQGGQVPDPSIPSTVLQPADTTTQQAAEQVAALQPDQEAPAVDADDPIASLIASPPLPIDKPVPPSRQADPGPAVPTGPVEIGALPGSVPREDTQAQDQTAPVNLNPGQPVTLQPAEPAQPATQAEQATTQAQGGRTFDDEPGSGTSFNAATPAPETEVASVQPQVTAPAEQVITGGRYVVQLASFRTETEAQQEFQRLQGRHGTLLGGYSSFIQQADLGSRGIYYRLRIGPIEDRSSASQLCNSLISAGERDCFVGER